MNDEINFRYQRNDIIYIHVLHSKDLKGNQKTDTLDSPNEPYHNRLTRFTLHMKWNRFTCLYDTKQLCVKCKTSCACLSLTFEEMLINSSVPTTHNPTEIIWQKFDKNIGQRGRDRVREKFVICGLFHWSFLLRWFGIICYGLVKTIICVEGDELSETLHTIRIY